MTKYPFLFVFICAVLVSVSCSKSHSIIAGSNPDSTYNNRTLFYLQDNFTFSFYVYALSVTGWKDTLSAPGPYTVLAPENSGFQSSNWNLYSYPYITELWTPAYFQAFMQYSIMDGRYSMDSLPIGDNQVLPAGQGFHIYVSKYLQGGDMVITINGSVVAAADISTTNGLVQALSYPINPEQNHTLASRIENDNNLTMFALAMQRVHADLLLAQPGPYTVLVPTNAAFTQAAWQGKGLSTMDSLLSADTAILGPVVRSHIIQGMYFINDFARRYTSGTDTLKLPTLCGEAAYLYMGRPNPWSSPVQLFLGGSDNGLPAAISTVNETPYIGDIPAGNGVIQEINEVLAL